MLRAFQAAHPGLGVRQEYVSGWHELYDTKMRQQILSGTLPDGGRVSQRFIEALSYSRLQPETPHFRVLDRAINRHMARLLADKNRPTPAEMLADLAAAPALREHFNAGEETR